MYSSKFWLWGTAVGFALLGCGGGGTPGTNDAGGVSGSNGTGSGATATSGGGGSTAATGTTGANRATITSTTGSSAAATDAGRADAGNNTGTSASSSATGASATGSSATGSTATGSDTTGSSATGSTATGSAATGSTATDSTTTGSTATGGATSSSATGVGDAGRAGDASVTGTDGGTAPSVCPSRSDDGGTAACGFVDGDFIATNGTAFKGGFRFIGTNLDPWRFITAKGEVYSQADLSAWVDRAHALIGANVIRMHVNGGAFEPTIGTYAEAPFVQLDRLLAAANASRVRVVVALRDYLWGPWPTDAYDPYWYVDGGTTSAPNKDAILLGTTAKAAFKAFVTQVINRRNTVTGRLYRDEPAILGWELINEPQMVGVLAAWLSEMAAQVRTLDPNHLIGIATVGVEGDSWGQSSEWAMLAAPELDFLDIHYYADAALYDPVDAANVARIKDRVDRALTLGKPVFVGEFGAQTTQPVARIASLYGTVASAAFSRGASGALSYAWGPPGPNGWGGIGGFDIYTGDTALCAVLKSAADGL